VESDMEELLSRLNLHYRSAANMSLGHGFQVPCLDKHAACRACQTYTLCCLSSECFAFGRQHSGHTHPHLLGPSSTHFN
jgi:hypothetical protein